MKFPGCCICISRAAVGAGRTTSCRRATHLSVCACVRAQLSSAVKVYGETGREAHTPEDPG